MPDLYETLRARATTLSEDEFVSYVKHPVLLFDLGDEDFDGTEMTHISVVARSIALNRSRAKTVCYVTRRSRADGPLTVGRDEDCDLVVNHPSVSKHHADIVLRADHSLSIRDARSRSGVLVNDRRISSDTFTALANDDDITIGNVAGTLLYPRRLFQLLRGEIKPSPLRSLRNRPFAVLWLGQTISQLGDGVYRLALLWWVLQTTGSGFAVGALALFQTVPMLAFLLLGGVVVDRISRPRVMLASDVVRGIVTGVVALLAVSARLEVWHAYVASIVFGLADAFFVPAYTAIVPQLVRPSDRPSANALTSLSWQIGGVAGFALGAALVSSVGTAPTLAIEAASFFVSAACLIPSLRLLRLRPDDFEVRVAPRALMAELREGIAIVVSNPWLWITIVAWSLCFAVDQAAFLVALPYRINAELHLGAVTLGIVQALYFAGTLGGTIWMSRVGLRHRGVLWYAMLATLGLCIVGFGMPITIYGIAVVSFVRGIALSIIIMIWLETVQQIVPHDKLGRVNSIDTFGSTIVTPFALAAVGWFTDHTSLTPIFVIGGVSVIAVAGLAVLHPGIRAVD